MCLVVAGFRTFGHNHILDGTIQALQYEGYHMLRERAIPTDECMRYMDIVCWRDNSS